MPVLDFDPSAVFHIAHLAAAIEVVDKHVRAVHHHMGAIIDRLGNTCNEVGAEVVGYIMFGVIVIGDLCQHFASVAAAIHRANAASRQSDSRQTSHVGPIVTAKEGSHVVEACAVP